MAKISILFKPSKSKVTSILNRNGFYDLKIKEINDLYYLKENQTKFIIKGLKNDNITQVYDYLYEKYKSDEYVFVLVCNILELFN